jgi:hypothetical protein
MIVSLHVKNNRPWLFSNAEPSDGDRSFSFAAPPRSSTVCPAHFSLREGDHFVLMMLIELINKVQSNQYRKKNN